MSYGANPWSYLPRNNQPGGLTYGGGGGYHNPLDAKRSGNFTPEASYPAGYLGTIRSRREDRVLNAVKRRVNERSYQRGVHRGEKIDPADYRWPSDFNPKTGLKLQSQGRKFAPKGTVIERLAHQGKHATYTPEEIGAMAEKYGVQASAPLNMLATQARDLLPTWK